ncbi:hypothetical protein ACWDE0_41490 [Streptomyces sp. 900105755]
MSTSPPSRIRRARKGVRLVLEGRRLFPSLTVEENLQVGAATGHKDPWKLTKGYDAVPSVADRRTREAAWLRGRSDRGALRPRHHRRVDARGLLPPRTPIPLDDCLAHPHRRSPTTAGAAPSTTSWRHVGSTDG